jgi:hypothetical protein
MVGIMYGETVSFWLCVQVLAEEFGFKVLSATLEVLLGCPEHLRMLGKFVVRNARALELANMGADWHGDPKNARPGSIQNPDIFVNGSGGGPVRVGTVRALMRKLSRGDGLVGSGRPGRIGTVRALVCKLARGDGPGGSGRSGTVREQFHPTQLEKLLPRVLRRVRETPSRRLACRHL